MDVNTYITHTSVSQRKHNNEIKSRYYIISVKTDMRPNHFNYSTTLNIQYVKKVLGNKNCLDP